jgi:glycosyltransferase involved in cell wall biosynthesis
VRIAFVDECAYTRRHGGAQTCTVQLAETWRAHGIDAKVFSFHQGLDSAWPERLRLFPYLREILIYPGVGKRFIPAIEREFDLLHFSATTTAARYRPHTPSVATVHGLFSRMVDQFRRHLPLRYKLLFNPAVSGVLKILESHSLANMDAVIALRQETKRYLVEELRISAEKIFVIPNGVDPEVFTLPSPAGRRDDTVLFIGRGTIAKGFDTLLEAASCIKGKIIAVTPLVSRAYQKLVSRLPNIVIIPRLNRHELVSIYQRARVFVLPSLTENSPLVTLEAMACGVPVVVTQEGAADYVCDGREGFIIPFRDSSALADRVNYLLEHPGEAERMGQAGRQRVLDHFTFTQHAATVLKIYQKLVPERLPELVPNLQF